jgi:uncharacterized protein YbaP (TraB family)
LFEKKCHGRTVLWYEKTRVAFEDGGVLLSVGTAHMLGEQGYVARLQKDGYTVTKI